MAGKLFDIFSYRQWPETAEKRFRLIIRGHRRIPCLLPPALRQGRWCNALFIGIQRNASHKFDACASLFDNAKKSGIKPQKF